MERGRDGIIRRRLILGRKAGQWLLIGDVRLKVKEVRGETIRLVIEAPDSVKVVREELLDSPAADNKRQSERCCDDDER
jgi:carbon storage regulator